MQNISTTRNAEDLLLVIAELKTKGEIDFIYFFKCTDRKHYLNFSTTAGDDLETKATIEKFVRTGKEMILQGGGAPIWGSAICCSHPAAVETTHLLRAIQMSRVTL